MTIGTTNQEKSKGKIPKPASNEASGPTSPTKPNPADCGVPEMLNRTTGIAEIVAVNKQGIKIIGYLNKLGIIIFIPPKETASVTPDWLTFQELITRTTRA